MSRITVNMVAALLSAGAFMPPTLSHRGVPNSRGVPVPFLPHGPHIGRNEPCPCGSGKKFKKCCQPGRVRGELKPASNPDPRTPAVAEHTNASERV